MFVERRRSSSGDSGSQGLQSCPVKQKKKSTIPSRPLPEQMIVTSLSHHRIKQRPLRMRKDHRGRDEFHLQETLISTTVDSV
jgi:hypothetical protein